MLINSKTSDKNSQTTTFYQPSTNPLPNEPHLYYPSTIDWGTISTTSTVWPKPSIKDELKNSSVYLAFTDCIEGLDLYMDIKVDIFNGVVTLELFSEKTDGLIDEVTEDFDSANDVVDEAVSTLETMMLNLLCSYAERDLRHELEINHNHNEATQ